MEPISGYTALTETISGMELIWKTGEGNNTLPDIYPSEKDVWKEIASNWIETLQQFINDEREYDEVDWTGPEDFPCYIEMDEHGMIRVWADSSKEDSKLLYIQGIEAWRLGQ